jgi:hypothetical protein
MRLPTNGGNRPLRIMLFMPLGRDLVAAGAAPEPRVDQSRSSDHLRTTELPLVLIHPGIVRLRTNILNCRGHHELLAISWPDRMALLFVRAE